MRKHKRDGADQQQGLAADAVDQGHRHQRHDQVGQADDDRLQQRAGFGSAGHPEDVRRVVDHGVDAVQLVEGRDHKGEQQRLEVLALKQPLLAAACLGVQRVHDLRRLASWIFVAKAGEYPFGLFAPSAFRQPARAFGNPEHGQQKRRRRQCHDAEHPTPRRRIVRPQDPGHQIVGEIGRENADHDVQLTDRHQHATPFGRRDFGDVHRRNHRCPADRDPAQPAKQQQRVPVPGQRTAERRDQKQDGQQGQHGTPSPPVAGPAYQQGPKQGADQRAGNRETERVVIQAEHAAKRFGGARNHGRVKAEQERAQRRDHGADQERPAAAVRRARQSVVSQVCVHPSISGVCGVTIIFGFAAQINGRTDRRQNLPKLLSWDDRTRVSVRAQAARTSGGRTDWRSAVFPGRIANPSYVNLAGCAGNLSRHLSLNLSLNLFQLPWSRDD